jgi:alpha-beta hydrolase superfamily lysophospholipase
MRTGGGFRDFLPRWLRRAAILVAVILLTIVGLRLWESSRPPYLKPWHRFVPPSELHAAEMRESFTLEDYLHREDQVFREVHEQVEERLAPEDRTLSNRYFAGSLSSPSRFPRDWNRTYELAPPEIRGGALLIHGLTDAPYSMRRLAEILRDRGIYSLSLRMPGHGTVPGALTKVQWEDWRAAARVGARHVRSRIGEGKPLYLVGYSNGGALVVQYALDVAEGAALPAPARIVLLSPMIGVTPAAGLARFVGRLAVIPIFEKARWLDVLPEYNPYKYNSFPANAGYQTSRLTDEIRRQIERLGQAGRLGAMPPVLAFQSLVDATVLTDAVSTRLFDALPDNGSELVLFDVNRSARARPFLQPASEELLKRLSSPTRRRYAITVIANEGPDTLDVAERRIAAGSETPASRPLHLSWPTAVYSLSHVAVPFPSDDTLYGGEPDSAQGAGIHLGVLAPRGERSVLTVSPGDFLRITWNPFFPYVEERVRGWIGS